MNKYEVLGVVGEGAYGVVLRCRNKESGEVVAIKKFKESDDDEVLRKTTLREVKILRMLKHNNIVSLTEAFRRKAKLYLVFEYVDKNLLEVLEEQPQGLDPDVVRSYIHQLVKAINWCHSSDVVHRDIKPENLLINLNTKTLKLCDFGFARVLAPSAHELTDYVATRWYRAPELLLGSTSYGFGVDMWAIGCIMGEISDGQPIFPGESEVDQLYIVQKIIGPLIPEHVEIFMANPRFSGLKFPDMSKPETLQKKYMGKLSKRALSFLNTLLSMDPSDRPSSSQCQQNAYFEGLEAIDSRPAPSQYMPGNVSPPQQQLLQPGADFKSDRPTLTLTQQAENGAGVIPTPKTNNKSGEPGVGLGLGDIPQGLSIPSIISHIPTQHAKGDSHGGGGAGYDIGAANGTYQQQQQPKNIPKHKPRSDNIEQSMDQKLTWGDGSIVHGLANSDMISAIDASEHSRAGVAQVGKPKRNAGSRASDLDAEAERERDRQREKEIRAFRDFSTKLPIKQKRRQKAESFDKDTLDRAAPAPRVSHVETQGSGIPGGGPGQGYNLQLDDRSYQGLSSSRRNNHINNSSSNNSIAHGRAAPLDHHLAQAGSRRQQQPQYGLQPGAVQMGGLQRNVNGFDSMDFASEMQSVGIMYNRNNNASTGLGLTWQPDAGGQKYPNHHQQNYAGYGVSDHHGSVHGLSDGFMTNPTMSNPTMSNPTGYGPGQGGLSVGGSIRSRGGAMQIAGSASIGRSGMYQPPEQQQQQQHMGGAYSSSNGNLMLPRMHAGISPGYKPFDGSAGLGLAYGDNSYGASAVRSHHPSSNLVLDHPQPSPYSYGESHGGGAKRNSNNSNNNGRAQQGGHKGYR